MAERADENGDPAERERDEPHHAEFVPHTIIAERRVAPVLDPASGEPGEEDPESSDVLDEALARALPDDDTMEDGSDVPVFDSGEGGAFPLVDRSPNAGLDTAVGDVDDEDRLEAEEDADDEARLENR